MADTKVELDDLFVEELKPRATPISTVVATECCGVCNSSCDVQTVPRPGSVPTAKTGAAPSKDAAARTLQDEARNT